MRIFSDPHIGLERKAHTTKVSRTMLAGRLYDSALYAAGHGDPDAAVCVGDLLDQFSNDELTIMYAAQVAARCDVVLAGNHDSKNIADEVGTLTVVDELVEHSPVIRNDTFDRSFQAHRKIEGVQCSFIPHHATQELFDTVIAQLLEAANAADMQGQKHRAIFLHCNYENAMTEGSDTALNLTKAQAEALLEHFDYIFMGHEHQPRELLNGRLIICGCTHPTSFSDISDKYYYDLTDKGLTKTKCWDMAERYAEIEYDGEVFKAIPKDVDFIDIKGEITADKGADLAEYISQCWEESGALMIRNSVSVVVEDHQVIEAVDFDNLPDVIGGQLKGGPLESLFSYYRGVVGC